MAENLLRYLLNAIKLRRDGEFADQYGAALSGFKLPILFEQLSNG